MKKQTVVVRGRRPGAARATVFGVKREEGNTSKQVRAIDEFTGYVLSTNGALVLPTPYNVARLYELREQSNMLAQCIDAYVTNIVLTGWEVDKLYRDREANEGEGFELQSFIDNPNVDQSLVDVMSEVVRDRETVGFGFMEVIRDRVGRISLLRHASAVYTRLAVKHPKAVEVSYAITRGRRVTYVTEFKRFRRFIQIAAGETRWFKEFGDPRKMNGTTGLFEGEAGYKPGDEATEIVHFKLPSVEAYGVPRWINQIPSIIGSREAEEVNMRYFQDNTVPPMLLMIGNGRLSSDSYRELNNQLNSEGIGKERQHKILLLEAIGEGESVDGRSANIDLKVEKLTDSRQSDGLFKAYDEGNMAKVRSSFRLPPVVVGMSQDVNFATATTSVFVAESQVFSPERSLLDGMLNRLLINGINGLQLTTAKLTSRTPSITSPEMVIKTLTALNIMGAITPASAQQVANTLLQTELTQYPKKGEKGYEPWMDKPLVLTTGAQKTHAEQSQKSANEKETENTGETVQPPKHGSE